MPPNGMANTGHMRAAPSFSFMAAGSVPQRLPGLEHRLDAILGLGGPGELDEVPALEVEEPFLVHDAPGLDLAATENLRDARGDFVVVVGDEAALLHVDEQHLER